MNCDDVANASTMYNSTIIKCIEHFNYTYNDFVNYNHKTLTGICKYIKVSVNDVNRYKVYKECKKYFDLSSYLLMNNTDNIIDRTNSLNENSDYDNNAFENCIYSVHTV